MLQVFGSVPIPVEITRFGGGDVATGALGSFLNFSLRFLIFAGTIYALFNLALAGYAFMGANDEPKKMQAAWAKIWQTLMGLIFLAGCFVLAGVFGFILYGRTDAILLPKIPTPIP